jgi:chromate transporter
MYLKKHIPFLRSVFLYACTAFGGPSAHIGAMTKLFVQQRKDVTQEELLDYFTFCQLLPGPSSTQTITLIGYKRGGIYLALLTLLIWCLPAVSIMAVLSIFMQHSSFLKTHPHLFSLVQPMAIGFLLFATWQAMRHNVKVPATYGIMLGAALLSLLFHSPWVFPLVIIAAGTISNFSNKRIIPITASPKKIKWINLGLFITCFVAAGIISELARVQHWQHARLFNLFENFYRFGSMVWGGGHALMGAMCEQFITLQTKRGHAPYLSYNDFLSGFGMLSCVPGPVFSVSSYIGGMATRNFGIAYQLLGCFIASVGVFLPSLLLVLFLHPIYNNVKQHVIVYRALEGIYAAVVGLMWASVFILSKPFLFTQINTIFWWQLSVAILSFIVLQFTKLPAPVLVIICLLGAWFLF